MHNYSQLPWTGLEISQLKCNNLFSTATKNRGET